MERRKTLSGIEDLYAGELEEETKELLQDAETDFGITNNTQVLTIFCC